MIDGGSGYLPALLEGIAGSVTVVSPGEAGRWPRKGDFTLLLIDGAIEALPDALAKRLAEGARVVTGIVRERGHPARDRAQDRRRGMRCCRSRRSASRASRRSTSRKPGASEMRVMGRNRLLLGRGAARARGPAGARRHAARGAQRRLPHQPHAAGRACPAARDRRKRADRKERGPPQRQRQRAVHRIRQAELDQLHLARARAQRRASISACRSIRAARSRTASRRRKTGSRPGKPTCAAPNRRSSPRSWPPTWT